MITLHILKLLEDEGFGTIETDLFFENVTLDSYGKPKNGVWIVSRPSQVTARNVRVQQFDIYSRYTDKITGDKKLEAILDYFERNKQKPCVLPEVPPYSLTEYTNIRIFPLSSIENVGTDENNKIIRVISGEIRFNKLTGEI